MHADEQNTLIEFEKALDQAVTDRLQDDTQLCKQFFDNRDFRSWMRRIVHTIIREHPLP